MSTPDTVQTDFPQSQEPQKVDVYLFCKDIPYYFNRTPFEIIHDREDAAGRDIEIRLNQSKMKGYTPRFVGKKIHFMSYYEGKQINSFHGEIIKYDPDTGILYMSNRHLNRRNKMAWTLLWIAIILVPIIINWLQHRQ